MYEKVKKLIPYKIVFGITSSLFGISIVKAPTSVERCNYWERWDWADYSPSGSVEELPFSYEQNGWRYKDFGEYGNYVAYVDGYSTGRVIWSTAG